MEQARFHMTRVIEDPIMATFDVQYRIELAAKLIERAVKIAHVHEEIRG